MARTLSWKLHSCISEKQRESEVCLSTLVSLSLVEVSFDRHLSLETKLCRFYDVCMKGGALHAGVMETSKSHKRVYSGVPVG
jgi:hypothetical protein